MVGSGQFGTPWARKHRVFPHDAQRVLHHGLGTVSGRLALLDRPVGGGQQVRAGLLGRLELELLTPKSCALPLGSAPLLSGSG